MILVPGTFNNPQTTFQSISPQFYSPPPVYLSSEVQTFDADFWYYAT